MKSVHKCPAKGQHGIEFFQIFFKIPPGIANIFDHHIILWGKMNPHSRQPPISAVLLQTHRQTHRYGCTMPASLHRKKNYSGLFIDWPFESQHMPLRFYSSAFPEMDHFLILSQGFLPSSGVTRTQCKSSKKEFKLIQKVCSCACAHASMCYFWKCFMFSEQLIENISYFSCAL